MRILLLLLLSLPLTACSDGIVGCIDFESEPVGMISVMYEGLTESGERISGLAGTTLTPVPQGIRSPGDSERSTGIAWDPQSGLTFDHAGVPAGTYVVGVRNGNWIDYRIIRLDGARPSAMLDFRLQDGPTGALNLSIGQGGGDHEIRLSPIAPDGEPLVPGADLTDGPYFAIDETMPKTGALRIEGLKPGRYRLKLFEAERYAPDGEGRSGTALSVRVTSDVSIEPDDEFALNVSELTDSTE